jgi:hypothetical protein
MSDDPIKQQMRRLKERTWHILDKESFHVGEARGKATSVCDFICMDKSGYRLVKVCLQTISKIDLDRLLNFNDSRDPGTIIQIFFWKKHEHQPFHRAKLYYDRPKQAIPAPLLSLVK